MRRLFRWLITFPILLIGSFILIANRHTVFLSLDPFNVEAPALSFEIPLYIILLITLFAGLIIGAMIVWFSQHKYRKASRVERNNANRWHEEADQLRKRAEQAAKQTGTELNKA